MIPLFPVYLFDIDGTLLDSAQDICGAVQIVLSKTPAGSVPDSVVRGFIGHHLNDLFQDLLPDYTAQQFDQMVADYRSIYLAREHSGTRLFPGVIETLSKLPGRKSTATTKGTPTTRNVLEKFGLISYFEHVQGTDGFPAKPNPDVVLRALAALNADPKECLLIGDSAPDMEAGRRAGVQTCAVTYGYGDRDKIASHQPNYWIDDLRELLPA